MTWQTSSHRSTPMVAARSVGRSVLRSEDPRLLSGGGRYLADLSLPRELHAALLRSNEAHSRLLAVDVSEAQALPGVHLVWTGADVATFCQGIEGALAVDGCIATVMPLLARDTLHYVGEPIALVVADSRAIAEDAMELISVTTEPLPPVTDPNAALEAGSPLANEQLAGNVGLRGGASFGPVDECFAVAHRVVEETYHTGRLSPTPMETRGVIASYDWASQELKLWTSTQMPHLIRYFVTAYLGIQENLVEVLTPDTGGGFGQKAHLFVEELLMPLASRELNRPVKWVEDRRENLMVAGQAHEQFITIALALDSDNHITAMRTRALGDGGAFHQPPWSMAVEPWCAAAVTPQGVYNVKTLEYTYEAAATNKAPVGAYRGVGYMAGTYAREAIIDEAARAVGMSPFDFRRLNVVKQLPWVNGQGVTYDEGSWLESIDRLEQMVGYEEFRERQLAARAEGRYLGLGISVFVESTGESTAMGKAHGLPDVYHDTATVRMDPNGTVTVTLGLTTQGQGNRTTAAQVAADMMGVRPEDVTVIAGDSTRHTYGSGTVASRGAIIAAGAIGRAAGPLRDKLLAVAANMLEISTDDIELADGRASVRGDSEASVSIADVATSVYFDDSVWPEGFDPGLEATFAYDAGRPMFSNGAQAALVEVDPFTGFVTVDTMYVIEDCGTVINPGIVDGQIRGGAVQGIGAALFEQLLYDDAGQLTTTTLMDYHLPTADVIPVFKIEHLQTPSSHTWNGAKGMGESAMIAAPAAVLNAVNDAIAPFGAILRDIPITPEDVLRAIGQVTD
ncbi:MAG: xanthine dehydrogenase family protein molybdopterin-binding subunit [Actinobacteria bacterium]|nr:xanthine dehydrogenase family protein molybdopterin-binding subunit [Actinomycetota bacterium]